MCQHCMELQVCFLSSEITGDIVSGCFAHRREILEEQHQPTYISQFFVRSCSSRLGTPSPRGGPRSKKRFWMILWKIQFVLWVILERVKGTFLVLEIGRPPPLHVGKKYPINPVVEESVPKGSHHTRKTIKKQTMSGLGDPPPKRVKSGHLLSEKSA